MSPCSAFGQGASSTSSVFACSASPSPLAVVALHFGQHQRREKVAVIAWNTLLMAHSLLDCRRVFVNVVL
jgi:hypothetical protein